MKLNRSRTSTLITCIGSLLVAGTAIGIAEDSGKIEQLAKENDDLRRRLESLEHVLQREGITPSCEQTGSSSPVVKALSDITLSGFVQASYFYNLDDPADNRSDGYLWNASHNSFSINKVKVVLASGPVDKDKWDAGFRASLIWGEDSPNLNTGSPGAGFEALREAYVELNAPIGTGLNIKAGQLISLLNWESGDGGAANPNFSQGFQWWFTGNGPAGGVQAGYDFTDKVNLKVRVQNGMFAGPVDNDTTGKAFIGSLGLKPTPELWMNLIGWFSEESATTDVMGGSVIGGYKINEKVGTGFEFDYFNFDTAGTDVDIFSAGGWIWYDFTPEVGLALRADYIDQSDGVIGPAVRPGAGIMSLDNGGDLGSVTLTLNWKPAPNIKIQPEIRYDYTSYSGGLDGERDRITIGAGASYSF
jgi:hypothetical protein